MAAKNSATVGDDFLRDEPRVRERNGVALTCCAELTGTRIIAVPNAIPKRSATASTVRCRIQLAVP